MSSVCSTVVVMCYGKADLFLLDCQRLALELGIMVFNHRSIEAIIILFGGGKEEYG